MLYERCRKISEEIGKEFTYEICKNIAGSKTDKIWDFWINKCSYNLNSLYLNTASIVYNSEEIQEKLFKFMENNTRKKMLELLNQ
jgi:hypothetical protein